jgi:cytochrome c peroxidase
VQIPDLIGIQDRKYLDRTGLVRHRDIADLMRYAALNMDFDFLSEWNGFVPEIASIEALPADALPPEAPPKQTMIAAARNPANRFRYSDEQLYALAKFAYSLEPPPNPNPFDDLARRGQQVFEQQDCKKCHPAPLYTSNQLTPVDGFVVPEALKQQDDIRSRGVGTDPTLALTTRRGTGFYKVPSLKGVWYRGPFSHDGSVATLEDWFDARRLDDDYVPTGWNPGGKPRAVPGHEFGLDLSDEEKKALIAFLKTL